MRVRVALLLAQFSEGIYPAVVERLEPQEGVYNREYLRWSFSLKTAKGDEVTCTGLTSTTFTPKSKFYKWASACTGREFQVNDELDTEQLHGIPCRVFLIIKELDGGGSVNQVERVLPREDVSYTPRRVVEEPSPVDDEDDEKPPM